MAQARDCMASTESCRLSFKFEHALLRPTWRVSHASSSSMRPGVSCSPDAAFRVPSYDITHITTEFRMIGK